MVATQDLGLGEFDTHTLTYLAQWVSVYSHSLCSDVCNETTDS